MTFPISPKILSIMFVTLCSSAMADGFRPDSDLATSFVNEVATAEIAVFPTIIRTQDISAYSTASQKLAIESLKQNRLGTARPEDLQFYLGDPQGQSQFEVFQNAMQTIGEQLEEYDEDVDYIVVIEVLFRPSRQGDAEVFGIHVYVLDSGGENAFSFLLNSHHGSFSEAKLRASKNTAKSREQLAIKSTKIAMKALKQQIGRFREGIARSGNMGPGRSHDVQALADVRNVWNCQLNDYKTLADLVAASSVWLKAAKSNEGGEDVEAFLEFPIAADTGADDFLFVVVFADTNTWGVFNNDYPNSPAGEAEEAWGEVATCSASSLWELVEIE